MNTYNVGRKFSKIWNIITNVKNPEKNEGMIQSNRAKEWDDRNKKTTPENNTGISRSIFQTTNPNKARWRSKGQHRNRKKSYNVSYRRLS